MATSSAALPASLRFEDTEISIIDHNGKPWVTAADLARALGYKREDIVSNLYRRNKDEFTDSMTLNINLMVKGFGGGNSEKPVRIFSPRGAHLIAMFARTDRAAAFRHWVLDVLDGLTEQRPTKTLPPASYEIPKTVRQAIHRRANELCRPFYDVMCQELCRRAEHYKLTDPDAVATLEVTDMALVYRQNLDAACQLGRMQNEWFREVNRLQRDLQHLYGKGVDRFGDGAFCAGLLKAQVDRQK